MRECSASPSISRRLANVDSLSRGAPPPVGRLRMGPLRPWTKQENVSKGLLDRNWQELRSGAGAWRRLGS
eukprot:15472455-Alexandrium_andersonii.AAC.1